MAENKDKDPLENTFSSDEMLFEAPVGLPTWASELEAPIEENLQSQFISSLPQPHLPDLDNTEIAIKTEASDEVETREEQDIEIYTDQQENIEVAELEEYNLKAEEANVFETPIGEPEFFQEPVNIEQDTNSYSNSQESIELTNKPLEQYQSIETESSIVETPIGQAEFFHEPSVVKQDYYQEIVSLIKQTTPVEENVFETPIGEPEFFQEPMESSYELQDLSDNDSITSENQTTIEESPLAEITAFTPSIEANLLEQEETVTQDSQTLSQDILDAEIASLKLDMASREKVGPLESLVANIDKDISYLDFDIETQAALADSALEVKRYLSFFLAGTNYAIAAHNVIEMNKVPRITFVPNVTEWISGVTNLRGDILAVIDMRSFLGLATLERHNSSKLLVLRNNNTSLTTGIIVDEVKGLREVPVSKITTLPDFYLEEKLKSFFKGVYKSEQEMLVLLDIELFLTSPELRQFELI